MKGFQDWFTEKHGYWPARPHENTVSILARLCDEVAQFVDQATGRGDWSEIEAPVADNPRGQKHPQILDGIYRVSWKSGGASLCAIGFNADGSNWIAPTNWIAPANIADLEASGMWKDFDRLQRVRDYDAQDVGEPLVVSYMNYRGEVSTRTITPIKPWYGSTEWHPEPQWLLKAFDHEKDAERDFALADFGSRAPAVKLELIRTVSETPVSSHGGPAAGISWELKLNGVLIEREYHRMHWSDRDRSLLDPIPSMKRKLEDLKAALGCTTRDPLETAGLGK